MGTGLRHARRTLLRGARVPARVAPRHTGPERTPPPVHTRRGWRQRGWRRAARPVALLSVVVGGISWMGQAGATFGLSTGLSASLSGTTLDQYLPVAATTARISATTCRVTWTPSPDAPAALRYDVVDGAGGSLATDVNGVTTVVTVPVTAVTPAVKARLSSWLSPGQQPAAAACLGWPDPPANLQVTPGDQRLDLSWDAPSGNGGTVASYTAELSPGGATCTVNAPTTACALTGLTNGVTYTVSVVATSEVGGSPAATGSGTPTDHLPSAPTSVGTTATHGQVEVTWSPPADDGGSPVTGYTATAVPDDAGLATRTCAAAASPCTVTGLVDGVTYLVTVAAENVHGTGVASAVVPAVPYPSQLMTPARLALWLDGAAGSTRFADAGCTVAAAAGDGLGCWADRSGHGHDAVQASAGSRPVLAAVGARTVPDFDGGDALGVGGLPTGTDPSSAFVVARLDDPAPAASGTRTVLGWGTVGAGGTRTLTKANASADQVVESDALGPLVAGDWTGGGWRGLDDGWSAAAGGTVQAWSAGTGSPAASATGYGFDTGSGSGAVGDGPGGGSGWVGPVAEVVVFADPLSAAERRTVQEYLARKWGLSLAPAAPGSVSAQAGGATSVDVSWAAPGWNGGSAVTGYTATASPGGATCSSAGSSCTITGLAAGQTYTVTVTATNARGTGPGTAGDPVSL